MYYALMRIFTYIDGYNLYHGIDSLSMGRRADGSYGQLADKHFLKWLDVHKLAQRFCGNPSYVPQRVYYFSASPAHLSEGKIKRHTAYVKALQHRGVIYVEGQFKGKGKKWVPENGSFVQKPMYEEKESDVNIAITLVRDSLQGAMDKALIITNDSDIAPAIRMARELNPRLQVRVLTPPLQSGAVVNHDLLQAAGLVKKNKQGQTYREEKRIGETALMSCLLPERVINSEGELIIRPSKYIIPPQYI